MSVTKILLASIGLTACSAQQQAACSFYVYADDFGRPAFDLEVPIELWQHFSSGEPVRLPIGPTTHLSLVRAVDVGVQNRGICQHGWTVTEITVDETGSHHFLGHCIRLIEST